MKILQLLGTSACHLCEQAEHILGELLARGYCWEIELIDIAEDDQLLERYGEKIPVLRQLDTDRELNWPFDAVAVLDFLEEVSR